MKRLIILILFIYNLAYSQNIYNSDYSNKYSNTEIFNDLKSYRTFEQLVLYDNNVFTLENQIYLVSKNKKKTIIRCSKREGKWKIEDNKIVLNYNNKLYEYRISQDRKRIFNTLVNKRSSKKMKFKKVDKIIDIICDLDKNDCPINDLK